MIVVGLMSGTSGDGIDAALVEIHGRGLSVRVHQRAFCVLPYSTALRRRILAVSQDGDVADVCHLNALLGELFAKAALTVIKQAGLRPQQVDLIGSHGQTIHHLPRGRREPGIGLVHSTLQIAEPAVIAERTGVTTIGNFRPRDLAAGGEGAPLAPFAHGLLFRHPRRARMVVNLGGISNVTYVPSGGALEEVRAFDTGPGNMVVDALVHHLTRGRASMDRGGRLAQRGRVHDGLLKELMTHPFLRQRPPKSTGREEFGDAVVRRLLARQRTLKLSTTDLLATCTRWTAEAVGVARRWLRGPIDELLVGGGGAKNAAMMRSLREVFMPIPVRTFDDIGWTSKAFEAVAFALLAYCTFHGIPSNLPAVTGASRRVVLGTIVPGRATWSSSNR